MDDDCVFCRLIAEQKHEGGAHGIVWFTPLNPVTDGHLLVVPAKHVADACEDPIMTARTMERAALLLAGRYGGEDANIITSIGPAATQTVRHLHLHIVPRRPGDGLHLPWTGQVSDA
jgi:histidine triad (HIT) family protein